MANDKISFIHTGGDWKSYNSGADLRRTIQFSIRDTDDPRKSPGSIISFDVLKYRDGDVRVSLEVDNDQRLKAFLSECDAPARSSVFQLEHFHKSGTNKATRLILEKILDNAEVPMAKELLDIVTCVDGADAALEQAVAQFDR